MSTSTSPLAPGSELDQLIDMAHGMTYQALAELAQTAEGPVAQMYANCLELRLQLHWGRIANWHVWTKGESEREGIRLANIEVGATNQERIVNALNGRQDGDAGEGEALVAASRESDLIDRCIGYQMQ